VQNLQFPMQGFLSLPVLSPLITGQTVRSACSIFHGTCAKRKHHQWPHDLHIYNRKHNMSPRKEQCFHWEWLAGVEKSGSTSQKNRTPADPGVKNLLFRRWRGERKSSVFPMSCRCCLEGLQVFLIPKGVKKGTGGEPVNLLDCNCRVDKSRFFCLKPKVIF